MHHSFMLGMSCMHVCRCWLGPACISSAPRLPPPLRPPHPLDSVILNSSPSSSRRAEMPDCRPALSPDAPDTSASSMRSSSSHTSFSIDSRRREETPPWPGPGPRCCRLWVEEPPGDCRAAAGHVAFPSLCVCMRHTTCIRVSAILHLHAR